MSEFAWIFLVVFFLELLSLFYFSKLMVRALGTLFLTLTKSHKATVSILAFLFLPGTIIHELAHAIVAGSLLVHVGDIEFTPEIREGSIKLGSAEIGQTDPIRRAIIGFAPVLVGVALILTLLFYISSTITQGQTYSFWIFLLLFGLLFEISNTMFSSPKDLEGTLEVVFLILATLVGLYLLKFEAVFLFLQDIFLVRLADFFQKASLMMFLPIVLDIFIYMLAKIILESHLKRRI